MPRNLLRRVLKHDTRPQQRSQTRRRRLLLESLEDRRVLAVTGAFDLTTGVLDISITDTATPGEVTDANLIGDGIQFFIDTNDNGLFDTGEASGPIAALRQVNVSGGSGQVGNFSWIGDFSSAPMELGDSGGVVISVSNVQSASLEATLNAAGNVHVSGVSVEVSGQITASSPSGSGVVIHATQQAFVSGSVLASVASDESSAVSPLAVPSVTIIGEHVTLAGATIDVSAVGGGGTVTVTGNEVILEGADINASGVNGAGDIYIGGGFQGNDPNIRNAQHTIIDAHSVITADALQTGDGGTVIVWSDGHTDFFGTISNQGAPLGRGGFTEVSGKQTLRYAGSVNTGGGMLLLDPTDFTINAGTGAQTNSSFGADTLVTELGNNNVTLQTTAAGTEDGDITVSADVLWNSTNSLTLLAHRNIAFNASVQNSNLTGGDINVVAGWDGTTPFDATTFLAADVNTTTLFGNNDGSIFIGSSTQTTGVAVGSRHGGTNVFSHDLTLRGSDTDLAYAQLGFHDVTGQGLGTGSVITTGDINAALTGGLDAQAGSQGFLSNDAQTSSYVQLGHGGNRIESRIVLTLFNYTGNVTLSVKEDINFTAGNAYSVYSQLGHGGSTARGSHSGLITITQANDLTFEAGNGLDAYSQLGHGGVSAGEFGSGGIHTGIITITRANDLTFMAGDGSNAYSQLGHGGRSAPGSSSGLITITQANDLTLMAGNGGEAYSQLGHGGVRADGNRSGEIDVTLAGDLTLTGVNTTRQYALVGHGDEPEALDQNNTVAGNVSLRAGGNVTLTNAFLGHLIDNGGTYTSGNTLLGVRGDLTADANSQVFSADPAQNGELRFYVGGQDLVNSSTLLNGVAHGGTPFPNNQGNFAFGAGPYNPALNTNFVYYNPADIFNYTSADISITKTDGVTSVVQGGALTYEIVVTNNGPSDDPAVTVTDIFPTDLTCDWTSVGSANAASGSGSMLSDTIAMPAGSSVTYNVNCTVDPSATGTLSNTATVSGSFDSNGANDVATDSDTVIIPFETEVKLVGNTLTITDINGGNSNDALSIRSRSNSYSIEDMGGLIIDVSSIPGATGSGTSSVTVPLGTIDGLNVMLLGGNDNLTWLDIMPVSYVGGGVNIDGGTGIDTVLYNAITAADLGNANFTINASLRATVGGIINIVDGNVSIMGNATGTTAGNSTGADVSATITTSGTGDIMVTGRGGADGGTGIEFDGQFHSTATGPNAGTITLDGRGGTGASGSPGTRMFDGGSITSVDGDIMLTGLGTDGFGSGNYGIEIDRFNQIASTGTGVDSARIIVNGTSGNGSLDSYGIRVADSSGLQSTQGAIILTGIGAGTNPTSRASTGVTIGNSTIQIDAGSLQIDATGGVGTSPGLALFGASILSIGSGSVEITAQATGTGPDMEVGNNSNVIGGATSSSPLTIHADSIQWENLQVQSTGDLIIAPRNAGTSIGLGGGTGTLNLDDGELEYLVDGFSSITIGDTATGSGTVDIDTVTFTDPVVIAGGTINDGAVTDINAGTDAVTLQGNVAPGQASGTGILITVGNLSFGSGSTFEARITGILPGIEHDQIVVTGTVDLSNATPNIDDTGFTAVGNETFVLIENDGGDPVAPFSGLPDGTVIPVGGQPFALVYDGGDGNDVILRPADTTPPTLLSFTRQNPPVSPTSADVLVFRVTFDEEVANVSPGDFAPNGTAASVSAVTMVNASTYDVTVSGGDLPSLNGTVGLDLVGGQDIEDLAGNSLPDGEPTIDETYDVVNVTAATEFLVNDSTSGFQVTYAETRNVAANAAGDLLITYAGSGPGDTQGIFARRFGATNTPLGPAYLVNTTTSGNQRYPSAALGNGGESVVVWSGTGAGDNDRGIFVRLYDDTGTAVSGEIKVNQTTPSFQHKPVVAKASNGDFIVTWSGKGVGEFDSGVFARRYTTNGIPLTGEFLVNTQTSGYQQEPDIAIASDGSFVITWSGDGPGDSSGVFFQRYNAVGNPVGPETRVNTTTSGQQKLPSIGIDGANNFTIVWSGRGSGDSSGIFLQRYNASGTPVGGEELVNTTTLYDQEDASISMPPSGAAVITWTSLYQEGVGGGQRGVYAQEYSAAGAKVGGEILINSTTYLDQKFSSVAVRGESAYSVVWSGRGVGDTTGVFAASRFRLPVPLTAVGGQAIEQTSAESLTQAGLDAVSNAAIGRFSDAGLSPAQLDLLSSIDLQIADLAGGRLGQSSGGTIAIDVNAAGYGWFVDATPLDNAEFSSPSGNGMSANAGSEAEGKMDLLTVVMHEMGHLLGLDHADEGTLMGATLGTGTRHGLDEFFRELGAVQ